MESLDYIVLCVYLGGIFLVGVLFAGKNKSSADMFAAGGRSPWWTSGLSAFMTMFSANTFVVWGGIAYRQGMVAVLINLMYGVAALMTGYFVAGKWKKMGVQTPAEFIQKRYGSGALHFFTWFMTVFKMLTTAGALYAMGRILVTLMPLPDGHFLQDPATGTLSLNWAIVILSSVVVIYTMIGGLWAVLMTDVLQFIVLNLAVLFVIPLSLLNAGGVSGAVDTMGGITVDDSGRTMLSAISGDYSLLFLVGWCVIHFFMIGAEWAFVQRFICVPDAKAARKSTYLFGVLYLVSPLLWLMPPMLYRMIDGIPEGLPLELFKYVPAEKYEDFAPEVIAACQTGNAGSIPGADFDKLRDLAIKFKSEAGYIKACVAVLPAGMIGLMFAAMFSATASMVSSQLNVFSGVLTNDIYKPLVRTATDPKKLLWVGRVFTVVLGVLLIAIALAYQAMGGAEQVIVKSTEAVVVALLAPTVWGLFSRSVRSGAVWWTAGIGMVAGVVVRLGLAKDGFLADADALAGAAKWVQGNMKVAETLSGVVLPVVVLFVIQLVSRGTSPGFARVAEMAAAEEQLEESGTVHASNLPAVIVAWCIGACGVLMAALAVVHFMRGADTDAAEAATRAIASWKVLSAFALVLFAIAGAVGFAARRQKETGSEYLST